MATTRGLEETPYLGSTRLERPDEAQFASRRHAETTAIPRQAPSFGADSVICIRPKCRFRRSPFPRAWRPSPRRGPQPASMDQYTAVGTRRKWGRHKESFVVVHQFLAP